MTPEEKAFYKVMAKHVDLFVGSSAHTEIIEAFERAIQKEKTPGREPGGLTCQQCGGAVSSQGQPR